MNRKRVLSLLLALVMCLTLLPAAVLADEEAKDPASDPDAGPFKITFVADGGYFPNNEKYLVIETEWLGTGHNIKETPPEPTQAGYQFAGWDIDAVWNHNFGEDTIVHAHWTVNNTGPYLNLDPNGGTCPFKQVALKTDATGSYLGEELPDPTRPGYTFLGWYRADDFKVTVGIPFSGGETVTAKWAKMRTSRISPTVTASPAKIEAGKTKIDLVLSCSTPGVSLDWRPLERALYSGAAPADWEAAAKNLFIGNFSAVGLKLTKVFYIDTTTAPSLDYSYNAYPDGICPADGLVLTLEGEAKSGTLTIQLSGQNFLLVVSDDGETILAQPSAQIFNAATVKIPVGSGSADGPFTVKFDLNYKDPEKSEIPKDQTIVKGGTVDLPDGSKLTCPFLTHKFYAWCIMGKDGKLYPWNASSPVTEDMTLYAGWVSKDLVIKEGDPVDAKPSASTTTTPTTTPTTATTTAPKFTDVAATSPFAPAISWAVEKGITNGTTPTTFSPGTTCTTGHILTFLWRSQGSPEPTIANPFADEIPNAFRKAAVWAYEKGLVSGTTFGSSTPCTRAASVTYMWKLAGSPTARTSSFSDVQSSSSYAKAVSWAVEQGVTNGTGDGTTFSPDNTTTRGQIVTFLYRGQAK